MVDLGPGFLSSTREVSKIFHLQLPENMGYHPYFNPALLPVTRQLLPLFFHAS
ncbi:hypothetical protein JOF46_003476 [Paeniglutamicibacter psychrophenolicus]|uniref:Uncharacterized protein n=1 Tax=Paeniglutamicibacter psychrophenolicus TaxID=257454 RepID=A0ABS4WJ41_9MICC|nr:hypothetical protein [Paeniglutamicibacter psychrophenolicus]